VRRINREMAPGPQFRQPFDDPFSRFSLRFIVVPRRAIRILLLSLHLVKLLALIDALSARVHRSFLRAPDNDARPLQMQAFIKDLKIVADLARKTEEA
jgi:hypothetical protein